MCWWPWPGGGTVPLGEVACHQAGAWARQRSAPRTASSPFYIFVDIRDRDLGGYVTDAKAAVAASVQVPAQGIMWSWSGQFEYLEARHRPAEDRGAGDAADHLLAALS